MVILLSLLLSHNRWQDGQDPEYPNLYLKATCCHQFLTVELHGTGGLQASAHFITMYYLGSPDSTIQRAFYYPLS